jgi:hypothetical protein
MGGLSELLETGEGAWAFLSSLIALIIVAGIGLVSSAAFLASQGSRFSDIGAILTGEGVSTYVAQSQLLNQMHINVRLGLLNGFAPDYYRNYMAGFGWTAGIIESDPLSNLADDVNGQSTPNGACALDSKELGQGVTKFTQILGVNVCELFVIVVCVFLLVELAIASLYLVIEIARFLVAKCKGFQYERHRKLHMMTHAMLLRVAIVAVFPLAFVASFQLTRDDGAGLIVLASLVLAFCFLVMAYGIWIVYRGKSSGRISDESYEAQYGTYYNDFNEWNLYFFVILLSEKIAWGVAISLLKGQTIAQCAVVASIHLLAMTWVFLRQPYLSYHDAVFVVLVMFFQGLQSIFAIVLAVESIDSSAREVIAVISLVIGNLVLVCILFLLLFRFARAVRRHMEQKNKNQVAQSEADAPPLDEVSLSAQ